MQENYFEKNISKRVNFKILSFWNFSCYTNSMFNVKKGKVRIIDIMDSFNNIDKNYQKLTNKQREIADYMLAHPEDVCYISLKDLSKRTFTSELTILRTCKRLGFDSYIDIKNAFRVHTQKLMKNLPETNYFVQDIPLSKQGEKVDLLLQICQTESEKSNEFYNKINFEDMLKAAKQIVNANTVLICCHALSRVIADYLYNHLSHLGISCVFIYPENIDNVQTRLAKIQPGDHLIVISFPKYFTMVHNIAEYAECKGATVSAITDSLDSPAITDSSLNFICNTTTKLFYNSLALPIALVNLLASCIVMEMGPQYDKLISDTYEVIHFINSNKTD
jgi:DNA-binding MurR/RpiR family transcriptional regulator